MVRIMRSNKIKLLEMLTNFHIGGTERQVANLAMGIDPAHFDLHLACLRNSGELLAELETLRVPRLEFRIGRLYSPKTLWQGIRLAQYVRRNLIQIVHSYGFYPNVFTIPVARLAGASIVMASIRNTCDLLTPMQRRLQKLVCRFADCILVNADAIRENLIEEGYDPKKIVVIRNGITLSRFAKKERGAVIREELGLPPSARLVGLFSRLNPMKGVPYFLEAASVLAEGFPDVYFLVVGDGAIKPELEEQARRMGLGRRIIFTGFRNDVPELLSEAAVSVLPSLSEGTEYIARIDGRRCPRGSYPGRGQSGDYRTRGQWTPGAASRFGRIGRGHRQPPGGRRHGGEARTGGHRARYGVVLD